MARHAAPTSLTHNARAARRSGSRARRDSWRRLHRFALDGLEARTLLSVTLDESFGSGGMAIVDAASAG